MSVPLEVKFEGDEGKFTGYGSVFGNVDSYRDVMVKGAFASSIKSGKTIPVLWQHKADEPIGVFTKLREDDNGLYVEGELNMGTTRGRESYSLLKQGAIKGLSIGFITRESEEDYDNNVRLLKEVDLMEISLVTFPANVEANVVGVKECREMSIKEFERFLREAGNFSRQAATQIAAKGFKGFQELRDADDTEVKEIEGLIDSLRGLVDEIKN